MASGTKDAVSDLLKKAEDQFVQFKDAHVESLSEVTDEEQKAILLENYESYATEFNGVKDETNTWLQQREEQRKLDLEKEREELRLMLEQIRQERELMRQEAERQRPTAADATAAAVDATAAAVDAAATSTGSPPPSETNDQDDNVSMAGSAGAASTTDSVLQKLTETLAIGLHLPTPELMKFNGDPGEYAKFVHSFEANIESKVKCEKTRLMYLVQYCEGEPKRAIDMCTMMSGERGYRKAREILLNRYGRSHIVAKSCLEKVLNGAEIKSNDPKSLSDFSLELQRTEIALDELKYGSDLDCFENLRKLVRRLPFHLRSKWQDVAHKINKRESREAKFRDLCEFVEDASMSANSVYGSKTLKPGLPRRGIKNPSNHV